MVVPANDILQFRASAKVTLVTPNYFAGRTDVHFEQPGFGQLAPEKKLGVECYDLTRPATYDEARIAVTKGDGNFKAEEIIHLTATLTDEASDQTKVPLLLMGRCNRNMFFTENWAVEVRFAADSGWHIRVGVRIFMAQGFDIHTRLFRPTIW